MLNMKAGHESCLMWTLLMKRFFFSILAVFGMTLAVAVRGAETAATPAQVLPAA